MIVAAPAAATGAARDAARRLGLDLVVLISPAGSPVEPEPGVVCAGWSEEAPPAPCDLAAASLVAALGAEALRGALVAYAGCFATARRPDVLARELLALRSRAGAVVVIEEEGRSPAEALEGLRAAGAAPREARFVPPDGRGAVRRLLVSGSAPAGPALAVHISDHQGKAGAMADALAALGHHLVDTPFGADAVLIDHDAPFHGKLPMVEACVATGGRAFVYPHGASAALVTSWDGLYPPSPLLAGQLVVSGGHAEIARRFGYPAPTPVIGWSLCDLAPRRAYRAPERVLFAPTHPPWAAVSKNAQVYAQLLMTPGIELTVRHLGSLEENALWPEPGVRCVRGDAPGAPGMVEQIDAADAVVADFSTFANIAVARGVTTVMSDSAVVLNNERDREPDHIDLYREYLRYPWETTHPDDDLAGILHDAARDTDRVAAWRERFIGSALDPDALVAALRGV
jgi:hypothetical protein